MELIIEQVERISNAENGQDNRIIPRQYPPTLHKTLHVIDAFGKQRRMVTNISNNTKIETKFKRIATLFIFIIS